MTIALLVVGFAIAVMTSSFVIHNTGRIKGVGLSIDLSTIDWGNCEPNSTVVRTIDVNNTGNVPEVLSLSLSNWNPSVAPTYIHLSWNYDGTPLSVNEVRAISLSLKIDSDIAGITSFSFDVTITGSG
jgi:hypothetical protein